MLLATGLFVQHVHAEIIVEIFKSSHYWPFLGNPLVTGGLPQKGPVIHQSFSYPDIIRFMRFPHLVVDRAGDSLQAGHPLMVAEESRLPIRWPSPQRRCYTSVYRLIQSSQRSSHRPWKKPIMMTSWHGNVGPIIQWSQIRVNEGLHYIFAVSLNKLSNKKSKC